MKKNRYIILGAIAGLLLAGGHIWANPSYFPPSGKSATATTTVEYLRPGLSTSTPPFDSYLVNQSSTVNQNPTAVDSLALAVQFAGSSTASTVNLYPQYSPDNIHWYPYASSTILNIPVSFSWTFASTTPGVEGTNATSTRVFKLDVVSRYTRVVIGMPAGSANGAVWTEFISIKQRSQ